MVAAKLRVCVLNVHSWLDADLVPRVDDVLLLLSGIACDVVMLCEVPSPEGPLRQLADALQMHAAWAPAAHAGNALLTRAPLVDVEPLALPAAKAEQRSAIVADVVDAGGFNGAGGYTLACTHLDHRREVARLAQLAALHKALERRTRAFGGLGKRNVVLGGDFNALRLTDYPLPYLDAVRAHRDKHHWEPPAGNVVARLDAWGFVDAVRLAHAGSRDAYESSLAAPLPPSLARTCWAGTRVDYVWLSPALAGNVTRVDAVVADVDVSDHKPLVVTLHR